MMDVLGEEEKVVVKTKSHFFRDFTIGALVGIFVVKPLAGMGWKKVSETGLGQKLLAIGKRGAK